MSLVELIAKGQEDLFLTEKPQMTLFKAVYRRNTVFTIEQIPQTFLNTPNFGKKVPCIVNRIGDLIKNITLVITLPSISQIYNTDQTVDKNTRFAWMKKIGFGIIKNIEIKIGDKVIEQFTGEWINCWYALHKKDNEINKMIGNVEDLFKYDNEKDEYKLYIPLPFWFSKSPSLSLPLCCLKNHNVEITLELEDLKKCYTITPTHYILMNDYVCQFEKDEYIVQKIDDNEVVGQFAYFDYETRRLYYSQITKELFKVAENDDEKYVIRGLKSKCIAMPHIKTSTDTSIEQKYSIVYNYRELSNVKLGETFLLVDYVFLEEKEKERFYSNSHTYLIEQVNETTTQTVSSSLSTCNLGLKDPVEYIVWYVRQNNLNEMYNNDRFNFTNSYQYNNILNNRIVYDTVKEVDDKKYYGKFNVRLNKDFDYCQNGKSLIKSSKLMFNGIEVVNENYKYFHNIQSINHFHTNTQTGLCVYSFALNPTELQPSGSCNMNKIDNVQIEMKLDECINEHNTGTFKCFSVSYNWLRIKGGYGGLLYIN